MRTVAILVLATAALTGCPTKKFPDASKADLARIAVKKLAGEAFPQFAAAHPDKACPEKLDDLLEYTDKSTTAKDPWGNPYKLMCGASLPAGAKYIAISSFGEDGKDGTADDITSWP